MTSTVHIEALALDADVFGTPRTIYPTLLWDGEGATLVDVGYPFVLAQLIEAVEKRIGSFDYIKRIILTHQDWDHIGALAGVLPALSGKVQIFAHILEQPYIEGELPYVKLARCHIDARLQLIPEELRQAAREVLENIITTPVDRPLVNGEVLPFHGGLTVIHTPGHTPGHICLYVKAQRLLISGDQMRIENNELVGPAPEHTPDMPTALLSLKRLLPYEIEKVICFHGGIYEQDPAKRIAELCGH